MCDCFCIHVHAWLYFLNHSREANSLRQKSMQVFCAHDSLVLLTTLRSLMRESMLLKPPTVSQFLIILILLFFMPVFKIFTPRSLIFSFTQSLFTHAHVRHTIESLPRESVPCSHPDRHLSLAWLRSMPRGLDHSRHQVLQA